MFVRRLVEAITQLTREVVKLRKVIQLRKPGVVFSRMVSKGKNGMSKFVLVLPEPGAADVSVGGSREITLAINGGESSVIPLAGSAMESGEFEANEADTASGQLVDIDDAGNRSEPRLFEIVLVDTIAPPQPGEVGVRMTAE